ncbi:hypothetical protein DFJ73DRAFT_848907 [Zopfochytrium polystomum]|nr:hypothetical protein DFJ73DRAFT_848907 [Zopfochytrium polystomum]
MLRYRTARSAKDEEEKVAWPTASLGVMVSDNAVNEALRCKIVELAEPLVAESLRTERWHPGSDRKVLDLIHPSNYPLCFGKTMYSQKPGAIIGEEVVMALGATETIEPDVSGKFQWLPSEFRVDAEGSVTVESYVNNLDGKAHAALVQTIAETFECLLPMLECSLGASVPTDDDRRVAASLCESDFTSEDQRHQSEEFMRKHRCLSSRYPYVTPELIAEHENDEDVQRAASESTFVSMADLHRYQHLYCEVRVPRFPPHCPASPIRLLQQSLKNKTLQVIVKMAEIRLTPEQPRYAGGKWHLEGMYNEAITATALVYYNLDNIADSRVKFRHVYSEPKFDYPQDQYFGLEKVYGFKAGSWQDDRLRESGHVSALQGRSVVFRNFHQHRVEPFELADKTRAGRRGVMAFFVVDPAVRLPSTRNVPCQQREAVVRELGSAFGGRLPVDVVRNVVKAAGCTMSEQEAGRVAEMVMEERSSGIVGGFANVYGITLCEH